jgi:ankyrin repeat protein
MDINECCRSSNLGELRLLIASGVDINQGDVERGLTPLHVAVENRHLEIVQELLNHNANPNKAQNWGSVPLHFAVIEGNLEIVRTLIRHGADMNIQNTGGWTPLHWAGFYGHLDIIKELLQHQADPNKISNEGWTPAMCALKYGKVEAFKELIQYTDVTIKNNENKCILDYENEKIVSACPHNVFNTELVDEIANVIISYPDIKEPE